MRKNIIVSSTAGFNPGDDFIRFGCEAIIGEQIDANFWLWNRNPDLDKAPGLSNSVTQRRLDSMDFDGVLFAGTPEWRGPRVAALIGWCLKHPEIPVAFWGIGSGGRKPLRQPRAAVFRLMKRKNVSVVSRDAFNASQLRRFGVLSVAAPCPAVFAGRKLSGEPPAPGRNGKVFVFSAFEGAVFQSEHSAGSFEAAMDLPPDWTRVCHYVHEAQLAAARGRLGFYHHDPVELLRFYRDAERVVSTRLHGAVAAFGMGVPAAAVTDGIFRIESCLRKFPAIPRGQTSEICHVSLPTRAEIAEEVAKCSRYWEELSEPFLTELSRRP